MTNPKSSVTAMHSDLVDIVNVTEEEILSTLRARFQQDKIFTRLGSSILLCINPFKDVRSTIEEQSQRYLAEYKDTSDTPRLDPHIFQHVNQAYFHMRRTGQDQSIMLSGVCGSSKSEMHQWAIYHLVTLSGHRKSSKIQDLVQKAYTVLEAFGHAKTLINDNASRFGKYLELQFNERGRMTGAKILDYMLEKSRVANTNAEERNFHVFNYMLHGTTSEEKAALRLQQLTKKNNGAMVEEDTEKYLELRSLMKSLGIHKSSWLHITQILAAILHLNCLQFVDEPNNQQDSATVKNSQSLDSAAELLGVEPKALETVLTYQTKLIKRDLTTIFLNAEQAAIQRNHLCEALYSLLFAWIVEMLNKKLCKSTYQNFIGIIDFPGAESTSTASIDRFWVNFSNELLHSFILRSAFDTPTANHSKLTYRDNQECVQLLTSKQGLLAVLSAEADTESKPPPTIEEFLATNHKNPCIHASKRSGLFTIQHFTGPVSYTTSEFHTTDVLNADFVSLFRGGYDGEQPSNGLVTKLFSQSSIATQSHPKSEAIVAAQQSSKPRRSPSVKRKSKPLVQQAASKAGQVSEAIDDLLATLAETRIWWVICLKPNDLLLPASCDTKKIAAQIRAFNVLELVQHFKHEYAFQIDFSTFCTRYAELIRAEDIDTDADPQVQCRTFLHWMEWDDSMVILDEEKVHIRDAVWCILENNLRALEKREQRRARCAAKGIPFEEDDLASRGLPCSQAVSCFEQSITETGSVYSDECFDQHTHCFTETESICTSQLYGSSSSKASLTDLSGSQEPMPKPVVLPPPPEPKRKTTPSRKIWLAMTWMSTWWIPSPVLSFCAGMRRADIRLAWREKVTLCVLIFLLCAAMVWFIAFFGQLVCPHQDLFTQSELQAKSNKDNAYITIRGEVFDLTSFAPRHWASEVIPTGALYQYAGQDASDLFPVQISAVCDGIHGTVPPEVTLETHINITDSNSGYHDFRYFRDDYRPDWYFEQMVYLRKNYRLGFMGYDPVDIQNQANHATQIGGINTERRWAILHNNVYDLTSYMMGGRFARAPVGHTVPANIDMDFIDNSITELFRQLAGTDISAHFDALPMDKPTRDRQLTCLRNLFLVGKVDTRNSLQCQFSEYLLLLITGFLCSVILFKFLAALRLASSHALEEYDKFIVCQVPCYTEGEESLRKTIDSLTVLKYDDKRKLLFLIADGMIVGSGNDRSTPRIVLDILGVDPNMDPEPMSFLSLGEGKKQHNMGKVYSGLYECSGHVVPYIVVVKVGTPDERQKPGNRGKRDSQMVLMRFLNKVHFDAPMAPLELEIHHQLKNVIGVNPSFYEFVLMVDADTEVLPDSLNHMVACFVNDTKIVGLCGETMLSNEKDTWVTMIQVYEYYISHHLAKAFESLFGSVTCLPGCFCMYRIRSTTRNQPLLASNQVIKDYAENHVDTLHKKNLLHLGEDRYLTTLILKHFPNFKTKFTPDAACMTNAPDRWPVLLSQRRRWINSTVHNLGELMFLPSLCGFCCFSMRFVVMLDLLSTLVMPAVVCYLGYLVYQLCTNTSQVPLMSIITLAGVYGLQAIIFILRRKWEHVGWMIVYILAIPVFSFAIPIYAFWHFDDFSWGNTRIVVGEKGQKKAVGPEEGVFDPASIPMKRWSEHETWEEKSSCCSKHTEGSGCSCQRETDSEVGDDFSTYSHTPSMYGSTPPAAIYNGPTDVAIIQEIERILDQHDLMQLTKKQVRDALSEVFGVDMSSKRAFINKCIEQSLAERL
ncbi:chitin synthase [Radiomyces spectabilis]|uniref:chitin synthase n=1 Tax=Radiomyces spectabilis TaxID=64574 RepID=UPI00221EF65A|nr:chitin synthase [Radiomyces spectabilis]KAI8387999.1 chitin synthase [Radiomyces spectabilis]